jgi:hypothetical protein
MRKKKAAINNFAASSQPTSGTDLLIGSVLKRININRELPTLSI